MRGLQVLGDECFLGSGLEKVEIPASIITVYQRAFAGCTKLTAVKFEPTSKLECIDDTAFEQTPVNVATLPDFVREKMTVNYANIM